MKGYGNADSRYRCPHCGAGDSTRCDMPGVDRVFGFTVRQLERAREVGCRVAYFQDHREETPTTPARTK